MQNEKKQSVEQLCELLLTAKETEVAATNFRVHLEQELIALVGCPEEGAQTTDADGYKVRVDQRIIRKLDERQYAIIAPQIPEPLRPVSFEEVAKIDTKGLRWLRDNEPGYYKLVCSALEEKPAKPSVKVEVVK